MKNFKIVNRFKVIVIMILTLVFLESTFCQVNQVDVQGCLRSSGLANGISLGPLLNSDGLVVSSLDGTLCNKINFTGNTNHALLGNGTFGPTGVDNDWDHTSNFPDMFNLNTGNIGIGVINPAEKLDLAGSIRLTEPSDSLSLMFIRPSIDVTTLNPGNSLNSIVSGQITNRYNTHLVIDIIANDEEDSFAMSTVSNLLSGFYSAAG